MRSWATGAPYEAEPSIPILTSGVTLPAQAASSTKPAGSQLNVRSPMTLPTSSTAQAARVRLWVSIPMAAMADLRLAAYDGCGPAAVR